MADNMDDNIKKAKAYQDALNAINKQVENQNQLIGNLANEMGIAYSSFLTQTKKTQQERLNEIKLINDAKKAVEGQKDAISEIFNETLKLDGAFKKSKSAADEFAAAISSANADKLKGQYSSIEEVQAKITELGQNEQKLQGDIKAEFDELVKIKEKYYKDTRDFQKENEQHFEDWLEENEKIKEILDDLPFDSIADKMKLIQDLRDGDLTAAEQILSTDKLNEAEKQKILGIAQQMTNSQETLNDLQAESQNMLKTESSLRKNMWNMVKQNSDNAFKGIWEHMKATNQAFKDAQKNFGLVFDDSNYTQMANLTSKAAEFNMSVGETVEMMGQLGDELRTTDTQYLASATEHFVAIQKATGISSGEITTIAGEMMRAGQSAEEVEQYMEGTNKMAKLFNVNSKKILQGVARNIDKMRQMGFTGGEESLTRMVATAERLRMNVDEIFDVAKRARTIEGAMDMAAELQLAGGSFAEINPMDLLAAARKGPEELQKILTSMGDDIGSWNKETGEFQFDPVDVDRLQMVADATGQSLDSIQKMIQKNAEDAKKVDFMPDLAIGEVMGPDGKPLDQDMMDQMLADSVDVHGNIIEGSMLDKAGIEDIKDLTGDQAQGIIQDHINKQATLEEQAKQNQSLQDSMTAFKDAVMNLFVVFQPIIDILTEFIQTINGMGPVAKGLIAALIGFVAIAPKLGMAMQGLKGLSGGGKGILGGAKKMLGMGKQATPEVDVPGADSKDPVPQGKGETGLQRLAKGLKAMGEDFGTVMKGVVATAAAGPALLLLLPGVPTIFAMAGVGALGKFVEMGFRSLSNGIGAMGQNMTNILKGSLAMVVVGASLIPFAFALGLMADVSWKSVIAGLGFLLVSAGIIIALGAIMMSGVGAAAILLGAVAMIAIAAAVLVFAVAMNVLAPAAEALTKVGFGWMIDMGMAMLMAAPGLLIGGMALLMAAPGILFGALALGPMVDLAERVNEVDWNKFAQMGDALLAVVPGLLAFSAGALIGGLMSGIGSLLGGGGPLDTLQQLADIAIVAADPLMVMAQAIDGLADGIEKLQTAASNLDVEKLEMLRSLSWSMAIGAMGGGMMGDAINKIAEALMKLTKATGGGGAGGGGNKKIEINLKLNGRDMQSIIVDDTEIVT